MAFTVNDLQDLTRLLLERPEWLSEVRRIVLTDELLALPRELAEAQRRTDERFAELADSIRQLAEAQQRTDKRLAEFERRTDERFAELAGAQRRTEERLEQLTLRVEQLTEAQHRTDARVDELAEAQRRTEERLDQLIETTEKLVASVRTLENQMADVRGRLLETEYRDKAPSFFGLWLRKPRVVSLTDVWDTLEDRLSREELELLLPLDLLVRGQISRKDEQDKREIWLAVEVSGVINISDVERAVQRAALLRKAGFTVVPVVAGQSLIGDAATRIEEQRAAVLINGLKARWDEALQQALSQSAP